MHRTTSTVARALAATLATFVATTPAVAAVKTVTVVDGTFFPKVVSIKSGQSVEWVGLGRTDAIARLSISALAPGGVVGAIDPYEVCSDGPSPDDPSFVATDHLYRQAYEGLNANELTGPGRRGVSGIWVLGPEGNGVSKLEIPSDEATAIHAGITVADGCGALTPPDVIAVEDDLGTPEDETLRYHYVYEASALTSGDDDSEVPLPNPVAELPNPLIGSAGGTEHLLCSAHTELCDANQACTRVEPDAAVAATIPPGVYYNGLLTSTYANDDVAGVVLRFNWKDLQYDAGGTVTERWDHLDREIERAIAHGKLVTLDVRAGLYGTPDWIFSDWLRADADDQDDTHAAPWCAGPGPCAYAAGTAPADAGQVEDLVFLDHYNEDVGGDGCGSEVRIGSPGDDHYRALYQGFMTTLAGHLAEDTRRWQAVAHLKVSGANLQTSEAELPHHCDDLYTNTADHQANPKAAAFVSDAGDRVLDVYKSLTGPHDALHRTVSCECNPKLWLAAGYTPQLLYDYYALLEQQIVNATFGEKSLGYQVIQAGFPRTDATTGHFYGDHLYQEALVTHDAAPLPSYEANAGFEVRDACTTPSIAPATGEPGVIEDRVNDSEAYCASDVTSDPANPHVLLAIEPVDDAASVITIYDGEDTSGQDLGEVAPGRRYPGGTQQAEEVMDQAADGHFIAPLVAGSVDRVAGKLFVPQHSGLQPLTLDKVAIGFTSPPALPLSPTCPDGVVDVDEDCDDDNAIGGDGCSPTCRLELSCNQQLFTRDTTEPTAIAVAWPAATSASVGRYVAQFPIDPTTLSSNSGGCPNPYIVDRGKDRDHAPFTPFPNLPALTYPIDYPAQLTGFQTNNGVISPAHVESTLMNLVYNSNAVFIELYETAVWQIRWTRGMGPSAVTLDDPAAPERLASAVCGVDCSLAATDTTCTCYTKNLAQWSEELHLRRRALAEQAGQFLGDRFRAFDDPFPTTYRQRFVNTTGVNEYHAYINPSHCDPLAVDLTVGNGVPGALGLIEVRP